MASAGCSLTELTSLGSLLILINMKEGFVFFFVLIVHSMQNVETILLCIMSSLIRECIGSAETQLQGLLEQ